MRRHKTLFVAVEALIVLVLLPVSVNVATGGSLPPGIAFAAPIAWYVVMLLAVMAVAIPVGRVIVDSRVPGTFAYSQYHRESQRDRVLSALGRRWIKGALEPMLQDLPWIQPRLATALDVVLPSADLLPAAIPMSAHPDISEAFEIFDHSLLILGGPGSGKSTLLLELMRILLNDAAEHNRPIPVFLSLTRWAAVTGDDGPPSRWRRRKNTAEHFADWCVAEVARSNGIPRAFASALLRDGELTLLFDGLDEMPDRQRDSFVRAIGIVQRECGPLAMAVSCRTADYGNGQARLPVQGAIMIEPLEQRMIQSYLTRHSEFVELRRAFEADQRLWGLVDTPLVLALMASQVFSGRPVELAHTADYSRGFGLDALLDQYVEASLTRRRYPTSSDVSAATLRQWLTTVARAQAGPVALTGGWNVAWGDAVDPDIRHLVALRVLPGFAGGMIFALLVGLLQGSYSAIIVLFGAALAVAVGISPVRALIRNITHVVPLSARLRLALSLTVASGTTLGALLSWVCTRYSASVWAWLVVDVFLGVALYSLAFQAARAVQNDRREQAETSSKARRGLIVRAVPKTIRDRRSGQSAPSRPWVFAIVTSVILIYLVLNSYLVVATMATAPLAGIALGFALEATFAGGAALLGVAHRHPVVMAVRLLRPRLVIVVLVISVAAALSGMLQFDMYDPDTGLEMEAMSGRRLPWDFSSLALGFVAGQVVAYRIVQIGGTSRLGSSAVARVYLSLNRQIPWNLHRFLSFVTLAGVMHKQEDAFIFRHQLLLEHCAARRGPNRLDQSGTGQ